MNEHIATLGQHLGQQVAAKASYWGAFIAFITGLSMNELAALGGLLLGVATFIANIWFQWRRDTREERLARKAARSK